MTTTSAVRRPFGIVLLAALTLFQGVVAAGLVLFGLFFGSPGPANTTHTTPVGSLIALGLFAVLAIFYIGLAWGLWTLKGWAYQTLLTFEALGLIFALFGLFNNQNPGTFFNSIFNLIVSLFIFLYLATNRNVRAAFRQP